MKATIYKIVIFDAEVNLHIVDPCIFWDKAAAAKEAEQIRDGNEFHWDSIHVYEETADPETGTFRTTRMVFKAEK